LNPYSFIIKSTLLIFLFGFCGLVLSCSKKIDALFLIEKSIAAHGGLDAWNNVAKIDYLKTTVYYYPNGEIEQKSTKKITHSFNPKSTQIEWEEFGIPYQSITNKNRIQLFQGKVEVLDSLKLEQARQEADAALYVFWQPYKLLDLGAKHEYQGKIKLLDSLPLHALKVTYPKGNPNESWHYFFDPKTFQLKATQVDQGGRVSLIINQAVEIKTGLSLNKIRNSYFLDSLGKINYLRASYDYKIQTLIKH
jgi:hypothetical protein